ncbi:MAG: hypothetical protein ACO3A4_02700 [Silvanigrellaceae bacterium]
MKAMSAALTCICLLPLRLAFAEILAPDELDSISSSGEAIVMSQSEKACSLGYTVGVEVAVGDMTFPYGPPGFKEYKGTSRASGIEFRMQKPLCTNIIVQSLFGKFRFINSFPSSGRIYDVQAVSWNEVSLSGGGTSELYRGENLFTEIQLGLGLDYERFQYARGTFSFQTLPLSLGLRAFWHFDVLGQPATFGLDFGTAKSVLSRTLVKYDSAPTSSKTNASVVHINEDQKVSIQELEVAAHVGFTSVAMTKDVNYNIQSQHQLSLIWNSRRRTGQQFMTERVPVTDEVKQFDLDMKSAAWILRWSERI